MPRRLLRSRCKPRYAVHPTPTTMVTASLVARTGSRRVGDEGFNEVFHPIAERLLARCDGVLRVGGASQGADLMVEVARRRGLRVFHALREVPGCESAAEPRP